MEHSNVSSDFDSEDTVYEIFSERRVHFWRMEILKEEKDKKIELDPWKVLSHFNDLVYDRERENSKYVQYHQKRSDVVIEAKKHDDGVIDVIFGRINQTNIPTIERKGKQRQIDLKEDEGLFVISHLQIHPDGIVLRESVSDGPTMRAFRRYILKRNNCDVSEVNIYRIAAEDLNQLLPFIEEVKFMKIGVGRLMTRRMSEIDESLGGLFKSAQDFADFQEWEAIGRMRSSSRKAPILTDFWKKIRELRMKDDLRKKLEHFIVGVRLSEEEQTRTFDLLEAHLSEKIMVKRMVRDSKNSDSEDISAKMRRLYRTKKPKEGNEWVMVEDYDDSRAVQQTLDED